MTPAFTSAPSHNRVLGPWFTHRRRHSNGREELQGAAQPTSARPRGVTARLAPAPRAAADAGAAVVVDDGAVVVVLADGVVVLVVGTVVVVVVVVVVAVAVTSTSV